MKKAFALILSCAVLLAALMGCGATAVNTGSGDTAITAAESAGARPEAGKSGETDALTQAAGETASGAVLLSASEEFTDRDLRQTADLSGAETVALESGRDATITEAGVYVLTGSAENTTVVVDAGDDDKVQLVLDGVKIVNGDFPCIYVKNGDKVFLTTAQGSENSLTVTGSFRADGNTDTDAVIYAKDDLTLNGLGSLSISSTENGVSGRNDLKITGGVLSVTCAADALEARDSIRVAGGSITILSGKDGLHAENGDDDSLGYVYISGGTLDIQASDDGIHAVSILQIDGGSLSIRAAEGLEGTYVQLNGGTIGISASDDGINGARQSSAYTATIEVNGGSVTVTMGSGDTDGLDSNGNLYVNGGTLDITAQNPFDYDGEGQYNGGTIIVNGQETNALTNQFGGMMGGGFGGRPGGNMGEQPEEKQEN